MGLKQILQNFSWETLFSLPPSEILSLVALAAVVVVAAVLLGSLIYSAATGR